MALLNEPIGYDRNQRDDWTPIQGLRRAAIRGTIVAAALALLLVPIAAWLPAVLLITALRTALLFGVAWILMRWVQRSAGMCGPSCTALALVLAFGVFLSNHLVWAIYGTPPLPVDDNWLFFPAGLAQSIVPIVGDRMIGWQWLHPYVVAAINVGPCLAGGGFAAAFFSRD